MQGLYISRDFGSGANRFFECEAKDTPGLNSKFNKRLFLPMLMIALFFDGEMFLLSQVSHLYIMTRTIQ